MITKKDNSDMLSLEDYQKIRRQVKAKYSSKSYQISFYLGMAFCDDSVWIAKKNFKQYNVIKIYVSEHNTYTYTVYFGVEHYMRKSLEFVAFRSSRILDFREVKRKCEDEISKFLAEQVG